MDKGRGSVYASCDGSGEQSLSDRLCRMDEDERIARAWRAGQGDFRTLIERSADALTLLAADGTILYHNPAADALSGFPPVDRAGEQALGLVHPDDVEGVGRALDELRRAASGERVTVQFRFRHRDGSWHWGEATGTSLLGEPSVRALVINQRDITTGRRAADTLRESEQRLALALDAARLGVWDWDLVSGRVTWEGHHASLFGLADDEFDGTYEGFERCLHPADVAALRAALEAARDGRHAFRHEFRVVWPDGSVHWIAARGDFSYDAAGKPVRMGGVVMEITERRRAEEERQHAREELERRVVERTAQLEAANEELEAFSYSVSHDLRAPLRAIDGFTRILLEDHGARLDPRAHHYLERVSASARNMGVLIDDLLAFSRLSREPLKKQRVAPSDIARRALDALQAERRGRAVEVTIEDMPSCTGDPQLLVQVFVNLLSNALKFTRTRKLAHVRVGCERRDGEVVYFVRDDGVGFSMDHASTLFGVFQRLHRADEYEGTGVGLAIVQRIVRRHGGRVWVEAEKGKGATFYFTLGPASAAG